MHILIFIEITRFGIVTKYGHANLGQHWLRQWLVVWWHQAITLTNVDVLSVKFRGIHVKAISYESLMIKISKTGLRVVFYLFFLFVLYPDFPGLLKN